MKQIKKDQIKRLKELIDRSKELRIKLTSAAIKESFINRLLTDEIEAFLADLPTKKGGEHG